MRLQTASHMARKMLTHVFLICVALLVSVTWMACEPKSPEVEPLHQEPEPVALNSLEINKEAVNTLKRGLDYLSGLKQFNVTTQNTFEDVFNNSYRIDFETSADLTVSRPNKLRVERYGLEMHQLFFFDGNEFTLHNPYDKVYASEPLAGNIEDMFHLVRDTYGLSAPSADLIYSNSFSLLIQNVEAAEVIGKEMIGDVMCDHLLFIRPNVSFQIWISETAPFLPYKYIVTDSSTPQLLSYSTLMTNWDLNPKISDSMFEFAPNNDTQKIVFIKNTESIE